MAAAPNGCIRQDWPTLEIVNSKRKGKVGHPRTMGEMFCNKIFAQATWVPLLQSYHLRPCRGIQVVADAVGGYIAWHASDDGIEVAVRNVYDAFAQMKSLLGGLKKCSTSFLGADAWRKESWEGVVAWVLDGADDRGGTLKVYACSAFMVEAIAVLKALEWAWNRGWRSVEVLTDCLPLLVLVFC
ncbi:hypothetical protein RHMOL_Rhmol02G0176800 [Rhododendron molle]|uniref:Uncharacterized protein n=1 Tax=Rhododendron molle TaxID=49168 RepID=A0ACC0PR32_RHOML|nr:hypothetical protein RHMOL_Rhmol02G0176800 [Rhododendron molle]